MNKLILSIISFSVLLFTACEQKKPGAWMTENVVKVAIDETFSTIMDEEVEQFGKLHPEANMQPYYVTEDSAIHRRPSFRRKERL
jgi:hypothetical protein